MRIELVGAIHKITVSNPLNLNLIVILIVVIRYRIASQNITGLAIAGQRRSINQRAKRRSVTPRPFTEAYTSPAGNRLSQVKIGSFTQSGFATRGRCCSRHIGVFYCKLPLGAAAALVSGGCG
ncbi:hypothetical protein JK621_02820 [Serratia plymuthica]|uniref:hypothetical protein n=1 Tax=Serratia plymuthica TaxID=82996 RepID=UPI001BAED9FC|nr:hypothetical protein [Serratia plymuthica]QUY49149.1 hypothetical protein JK621_02820 [Serratia plymuthica]